MTVKQTETFNMMSLYHFEVNYINIGNDLRVHNLLIKQWERGVIVNNLLQPRSYPIINNDDSVYRRNAIHLTKTTQTQSLDRERCLIINYLDLNKLMVFKIK